MTGFGAAEGLVGPLRVSVELRSVNHRFFNPTLKLPGALARFEGDVREALRRRIARGHVTLFARAERGGAEAAGAIIDETRFAGYVAQLRALQLRHGLVDLLAGRLAQPALPVRAARQAVRLGELPIGQFADQRGVYGGAVGYLSFNGNMDTAIAIRTAVIKDNTLHIQAGAGVVADSVPRLEWKETMNKGRAIFRAVAMTYNDFDH